MTIQAIRSTTDLMNFKKAILNKPSAKVILVKYFEELTPQAELDRVNALNEIQFNKQKAYYESIGALFTGEYSPITRHVCKSGYTKIQELTVQEMLEVVDLDECSVRSNKGRGQKHTHMKVSNKDLAAQGFHFKAIVPEVTKDSKFSALEGLSVGEYSDITCERGTSTFPIIATNAAGKRVRVRSGTASALLALV